MLHTSPPTAPTALPTLRPRWTDVVAAAVAPPPLTAAGGPVFEENGLCIQLLPASVWWAPILTPDRRPICVAGGTEGAWLSWRPLPLGADWRRFEDQSHDEFEAYLRRRRAGLALL